MKLVILERDGTINADGDPYITSADDWILRPRLELMFLTPRLTGKPLWIRVRFYYWYYAENDIRIADNAIVEQVDGGCWVDAQVWVEDNYGPL